MQRNTCCIFFLFIVIPQQGHFIKRIIGYFHRLWLSKESLPGRRVRIRTQDQRTVVRRINLAEPSTRVGHAAAVPHFGLATPQPDLATPHPDLAAHHPDLAAPHPDLEPYLTQTEPHLTLTQPQLTLKVYKNEICLVLIFNVVLFLCQLCFFFIGTLMWEVRLLCLSETKRNLIALSLRLRGIKFRLVCCTYTIGFHLV